MTVIDFNKEKQKRIKKPDNSSTADNNTFVYYVVSQKNKNGNLVGYNASFIYVPNHPFSSLDIATLAYIKNETLKVAQELDKDIDDVLIINVIPMGILSSENNYNKWKNNND